MRKLRHVLTESLIKQNLLVRVRQMILAANDVRDAHLDVVDHDREVVERMAVGTQQHQVFDLGIDAFLLAVNDVGETRRAFTRNLLNESRTARRPAARAIGFFQR